jgi:hypothetical protein
VNHRWIIAALFLVALLCDWGCSASTRKSRPLRQGPKINLAHFVKDPLAYKGRSISLALKVDEPIDRGQGQSLRDYSGRDAKFTTTIPNGNRLNLVITIPPSVAIPDVGHADDVIVTFICKEGSQQRGNEAKFIEKRLQKNGVLEDVD